MRRRRLGGRLLLEKKEDHRSAHAFTQKRKAKTSARDPLARRINEGGGESVSRSIVLRGEVEPPSSNREKEKTRARTATALPIEKKREKESVV